MHIDSLPHHVQQTLFPPNDTCRKLLQLGLWPLVQKIRHLEARPIGVETWCGPFTVPGPFLLELGLQLIFEHLHDVLAENREELVAVEGAACCDVEALCAGVW